MREIKIGDEKGNARAGADAAAAGPQRQRELQNAPTAALIGELATQATTLAKKEIELAKTELREDMRREVAAAAQVATAGLAGFLTIILLIVTAVLALARTMPGWAAGLLASGLTLVLAVGLGVTGWRRLKRPPLARTRRTVEEGKKWMND